MRMQLYKMELYKIFHRKIFWIGILAILGLMFVYFWFAEVGDERCVIGWSELIAGYRSSTDE